MVTTTDANAASFLLAHDAYLETVVPGRLVTWRFRDPDGKASRLLELYQSGVDCPVEAHALLAARAEVQRHMMSFRIRAAR